MANATYSEFQVSNMTDEQRDAQIGSLMKRLAAAERWQAEHDGRINEKWMQQERWNEDTTAEHRRDREGVTESLKALNESVQSLKVRVAVICAMSIGIIEIVARLWPA